MKRNIIIAFALIFILFGIGQGVAVYDLFVTTSDLRSLVDMHEIGDMRQELVINVQKIKAYSYSSPREFSKRIDEIITHTHDLNETVKLCHSCHHQPSVQQEIDHIEGLIQLFEERLISLMTTTVSDKSRRDNKQSKVVELCDAIIKAIENMVGRAASTIQDRTTEAMQNVKRSYVILAFTFVGAFIMALAVARYLMKQITGPIDVLLAAAGKIGRGELGFASSDISSTPEFAELIGGFNSMSESLARKERLIQRNLTNLTSLNRMSLALHAAKDAPHVFSLVAQFIDELVAIEYRGILLPNSNDRNFTLSVSAVGQAEPLERIAVDADRIDHAFTLSDGKVFVIEGEKLGDSLFRNDLVTYDVRNILVVWIVPESEPGGALVMINKKQGDFLDEDLNLFGILSNNIAVALRNIKLYEDIQQKMDELQETQQQLFEAEKLTALGTLAGGGGA